MYSETCLNWTSLQPICIWNRQVQVKLSKISVMATLFKIWFIQHSILYRSPFYTGFHFIQESSLYRSLIYTGVQFIQVSSLYRIQVYTGVQFTQESSLYRSPVYTGFQFIQESSLYRARFKWVSLYGISLYLWWIKRNGLKLKWTF